MAMPPAAPPSGPQSDPDPDHFPPPDPDPQPDQQPPDPTPIRPSRTAASSELRLLRQHTPRLGENMRACYPAQRQLSVLPDIDARITAQRDI